MPPTLRPNPCPARSWSAPLSYGRGVNHTSGLLRCEAIGIEHEVILGGPLLAHAVEAPEVGGALAVGADHGLLGVSVGDAARRRHPPDAHRRGRRDQHPEG